jgi:hypothetical protein
MTLCLTDQLNYRPHRGDAPTSTAELGKRRRESAAAPPAAATSCAAVPPLSVDESDDRRPWRGTGFAGRGAAAAASSSSRPAPLARRAAELRSVLRVGVVGISGAGPFRATT